MTNDQKNLCHSPLTCPAAHHLLLPSADYQPCTRRREPRSIMSPYIRDYSYLLYDIYVLLYYEVQHKIHIQVSPHYTCCTGWVGTAVSYTGEYISYSYSSEYLLYIIYSLSRYLILLYCCCTGDEDWNGGVWSEFANVECCELVWSVSFIRSTSYFRHCCRNFM